MSTNSGDAGRAPKVLGLSARLRGSVTANLGRVRRSLGCDLPDRYQIGGGQKPLDELSQIRGHQRRVTYVLISGTPFQRKIVKTTANARK